MTKVAVTQADQEAAASVYARFRDHDYAAWVRAGTNAMGDNDSIIQAFARHRIEATREAQATPAGEVGDLVERLRKLAPMTLQVAVEVHALRKHVDPQFTEAEPVALDSQLAMLEAADTITSLQAKVSRLEGALRECAECDPESAIFAARALKPTPKHGPRTPDGGEG